MPGESVCPAVTRKTICYLHGWQTIEVLIPDGAPSIGSFNRGRLSGRWRFLRMHFHGNPSMWMVTSAAHNSPPVQYSTSQQGSSKRNGDTHVLIEQAVSPDMECFVVIPLSLEHEPGPSLSAAFAEQAAKVMSMFLALPASDTGTTFHWGGHRCTDAASGSSAACLAPTPQDAGDGAIARQFSYSGTVSFHHPDPSSLRLPLSPPP